MKNTESIIGIICLVVLLTAAIAVASMILCQSCMMAKFYEKQYNSWIVRTMQKEIEKSPSGVFTKKARIEIDEFEDYLKVHVETNYPLKIKVEQL